MKKIASGIVFTLLLLPGGVMAQNTSRPAKPTEESFTIENYYKVR